MNQMNLKKLCYGFVLLAMASCTENEFLEDVGNVVTITANIEAPVTDTTLVESRTFIDENDAYTSGVGTMWRPKEVIGVYGSGWRTEKKNVKFTSTNTKDAGTVSFSGSLLSGTTPKYAYYPYSEVNNNVSHTEVKLSMPIYREYHSTYKDLVGDFRAGVLDSRNWYSSTFTFNRVVALYRFKVNVAGTPLVNSNIRTISIKVNNKRQITGDFKLNLADQTISLGEFVEGNDSLTLKWSSEPTLRDGEIMMGYATAIPSVENGDILNFTLTTTTHKATFTRTSKVNQVANKMYAYTINLADAENLVIEEIKQDSGQDDADVVPLENLKLTSFKFEIAKNTGKILPGKVVGNSSTYKATYDEDFYGQEVACTIDEDNKKISLYLPYLNNRKLVPTFEIPEGATLECEAGEIVNGETEVDFSQYKQVAVVNAKGDGVIYDVELTNSGLPVVVINQVTGVTSTENDSEYKKASEAWYAATGTKWLPKDEDWQMNDGVDNFMVYNADGTPAITNKSGVTLDSPILASTRIRGNVTQQMPKKAFAVKLDKKSGVLDMKPHKRWVLLANWKDRTLMRNAVAFGIAKKFKETYPNDGIAWNPSGQFVELVYNGVHVGNYYLCEQIKIDENRLNIKEPYDAEDTYSGNAADYGYLMECDDGYDETWKFVTKKYIPFLFKDDGNEDMLNYAAGFVRGLEEKITAGNYTEAYKSMDLTSMVDFLLIQDLMMNSEMKHPKSCYTYINNGIFYAGPIWDFDWNTLPVNSSYSEESYSFTKSMLAEASVKSSSSYPSSPKTSDKNYIWYTFLTQDNTTFNTLAAQRWNGVVSAIQGFVNNDIPAIKSKIAKSEAENNAMWPVDAKDDSSSKRRGSLYGIGGWWSTSSAGYCGDEGLTFDEAVSTLQNTLNTRISGMNTYVNNKSWRK